MRTRTLLLSLVVGLGSGCADVTSPEDGTTLGPLVQVKDFFTSAWLLDTGDSVVLFDAGYREGRMGRALDDLGVAPADVDHVFLTHGHTDHVGAIGLYPDATIHALAAEAALVEEESGRPVDRQLADGDQLQLGAQTIEVFAVPGHTEGSAVYLVGGVLVLGDTALVDRDGRLVPVPEKRSDDPEQAVTSLQALADRLSDRADTIVGLAPAHSAPVEGFIPLAEFPQAED